MFLTMATFKKTLILFLILVGVINLKAQESISSAGNFNKCCSGSMSWSLGEISQVGSCSININESYTEQQTSSDFTTLELDNSEVKFSIYPNPFTEYITIAIGEKNVRKSELCIYSINGALILTIGLTANISTLQTTTLDKGTYIAKIQSGNNTSQSFTILKLK